MASKEKQLVVYGAGGWLGRSFINASFEMFDSLRESDLLLIGSKSREIQVGGWKLNVHSRNDASALIKPGAIFVNAAFLRSEYLAQMSPEDYIIANDEISSFAKQAIESFELSSFVNLSSGAAAIVDGNSGSKNNLYGELKRKWEINFRETCGFVSCNFINNRIYSVSGRYINEFHNLALSVFIQNSLNNEIVNVKSPKTFRSYIDAEQLSEVLIKLSLDGFSGDLDSGGILVNMEQLANLICNVTGRGFVDISEFSISAQDYYGNYKGFNEIAERMGVKLSSLESQIIKTITAFA